MFAYIIPFFYNFIVTGAAYYIKKYKISPLPQIYNTYYNATLSLISLYISICVATIWFKEGELYGPICIRNPPELEFCKNIFYWLKYIEWYDTIHILLKNGGNKSEITNLHFYHHAIVPLMVHYGLGNPGDVYVILSNSVAHFLMYGYYAFPSMRFMKSYITFYQTIQHVGAFIIASFHSIHGCNVSYPYINILGYMFFLYEYLALLIKAAVSNGGSLKDTGVIRAECPVCIISSLIYLTNAAHAYMAKQEIMGHSFLILTATSIIFRLYPKYVIIDYIAVMNIMYQGGVIVWSRYLESGMTSNIFIVVVLCLFVNYTHINHKLSKFRGDRSVAEISMKSSMSEHEINYRHVVFVHLASSIGLHLLSGEFGGFDAKVPE